MAKKTMVKTPIAIPPPSNTVRERQRERESILSNHTFIPEERLGRGGKRKRKKGGMREEEERRDGRDR